MGGSCPEGKSEVIVWGTKVRGILFWGGGGISWGNGLGGALPGGSVIESKSSITQI